MVQPDYGRKIGQNYKNFFRPIGRDAGEADQNVAPSFI